MSLQNTIFIIFVNTYFLFSTFFIAYNCLLCKIIRKILNQNLNPLKNFIQMVFIMMKCLSALIFSTIW